MASFTLKVKLNTSPSPGRSAVTVNPTTLAVSFGTDTIYWIPAKDQSGWKFKSIVFTPSEPFVNIKVKDRTIRVTDEDANTTGVVQTFFYTLYVKSGTTVFNSDPYILNEPERPT